MNATNTNRGEQNLIGRLTGSKSVGWVALGLVLAVLAGIVGVGAFHLRAHLREHLVNRDGEVLYAVALGRQYANGAGSNLTRRIEVPADQLALALDISRMREGTLAVRLFDREGRFVTAVPPTVEPATLTAEEMRSLRALEPVSRFHEHARVQDQFLSLTPQEGEERISLLEVNIPIHARGQTQLVAAAQLLVDGRPLLQEYGRIDRHLWWIALGLYAGGAGLLATILVWAYRRLNRAQAQLADRTSRLLRANHELSLAAKTSALGSVTAHLIHGLSNPLANLKHLVATHNGSPPTEIEAVAAATQRMQQLVDEVVRILGEERVGERYELSMDELAEVLRQKLSSAAEVAGVPLEIQTHVNAAVNNRTANLTLLILENLVHNALKVSGAGQVVRVDFRREVEGPVTCTVTDQGPGLPTGLVPFQPCRSTHGGSGLGLAISHQLASQLGAELALVRSSSSGCVFALRLPPALLSTADTEAVAAQQNRIGLGSSRP